MSSNPRKLDNQQAVLPKCFETTLKFSRLETQCGQSQDLRPPSVIISEFWLFNFFADFFYFPLTSWLGGYLKQL
jgi:hypothetical protein